MIYVCMQGWSDDKPVKTKQIYPDLEAGKEHIEKTLSNFPSANKEPMGAFLRVFSNDHKTDFTLTMAEMESLDLVQAGDIYLATYKYRDDIYIQVEKGRGLQLVYLYRFGSDMKHCIFRLHNEAELEDSYLLGFVSDDIDESIEDLESLDT